MHTEEYWNIAVIATVLSSLYSMVTFHIKFCYTDGKRIRTSYPVTESFSAASSSLSFIDFLANEYHSLQVLNVQEL